MSVALEEVLAETPPARARIHGRPLAELPVDLYIPPDALEVFLEAFEGPLDLLLYLIKRQNIDILDIPIARVTEQYMRYIDLIQGVKLDLAAEYLVMAATLAEIKSRLLLPRPAADADEEADPRVELVRRLQEYERYKKAAEDLDALPRLERDIHPAGVEVSGRTVTRREPPVIMEALALAFGEVLKRTQLFSHHRVSREPLSVRERMSSVLGVLAGGEFAEFCRLFQPEEGRMGAVVTLLAVLELLKDSLIEVVQAEPLGPIYLRAAA
jgi:segregation and condensation protein A